MAFFGITLSHKNQGDENKRVSLIFSYYFSYFHHGGCHLVLRDSNGRQRFSYGFQLLEFSRSQKSPINFVIDNKFDAAQRNGKSVSAGQSKSL